MRFDAKWCVLVQNDAFWCKMMRFDTKWFVFMQKDAFWCKNKFIQTCVQIFQKNQMISQQEQQGHSYDGHVSHGKILNC